MGGGRAAAAEEFIPSSGWGNFAQKRKAKDGGFRPGFDPLQGREIQERIWSKGEGGGSEGEGSREGCGFLGSQIMKKALSGRKSFVNSNVDLTYVSSTSIFSSRGSNPRELSIEKFENFFPLESEPICRSFPLYEDNRISIFFG